MATLVGTQNELAELLNQLLELDYDAVEAYRVAVARMKDSADRAQLTLFMADHERHTRELTLLIQELDHLPSAGPDLKQWLAKGKVAIGSLVSDRAILLGLKASVIGTHRSYQRAVARTDLPIHIRDAIERNLADERRHRDWVQHRLASYTPSVHAW